MPPVECDPFPVLARHGVDDREVVGQDTCSRVEEDVAGWAETQEVLDYVWSVVLSGSDMGRFAVSMAR